MATRKIKDAKDLSTQELIYFKGHAKATFMSDGATVEDAVRAVENATYKNKGYFPTLAELQSAFPEGSAGSRAYVGSTYPYSIYLWQNGAWVDSGATGGDESVDLASYYTKSETDTKLTELSAETASVAGVTIAYSGEPYMDIPMPFTLSKGMVITDIGTANMVFIKRQGASGYDVVYPSYLPYTLPDDIVAIQSDNAELGSIRIEGSAWKVKSNEEKINALDASQNESFFETGFLNDVTGEELYDASVSRTSFIPCKKGDVIEGYLYRIHIYDDKHNYIKVLRGTTDGQELENYTMTETCSFVRLVYRNTRLSIPKVNGVDARLLNEKSFWEVAKVVKHIENLPQKINISLITASNEKVDFKTGSKTIDFTSNPLLCIGDKVYDLRALHSDSSKYRKVSYMDASGSSAQRIIFNLQTFALYPKSWADAINSDEVVIGAVRIAGTLSVSMPFEYTIDGKELWEIGASDEPSEPEDNSQSVDELRKHINVSLIADIMGTKPNLFQEGGIWYLDFGTDSILLVGNTQYVLLQLHSDTSKFRKIPLNHESGTSAVKVVFNLETYTFYTKHYSETLSNSEVLIGGIRTSPYTGEPLFNFPFEYTIRGKEQWETSQGSNTGDVRQLRCKTAMTFMAHRGLHLNGIPENSLDAYRYAARCGFDYAETDFQVTSDGELVLMHNESINATMRNAADYSEITGTINVSEHTLADLRENYVLASSDVRMRKPIPTLEEYFITCRNSGIFPVPEIKAFGMSNEQIKKAHDLGCSIMGEGNFGFCSFSAEYLDYARTLSEKTILCYIMSGGIVGTNNSITGNSRVSPTTWWYPTWDSQNYGDCGVTLENVRRHKEAGVKVAVWTTPVSQFDNLLKKEIDCISTDDICPSIDGLVGKVATSDNGFSDFETTGYESNGRLILSAGQTCRFNAGTMWLGGYYLGIIGKGNFTISAPNLNVTISNSKTDRYIYQGLVNNQIGELTITANGDSELEFVEFSCVNL